MKIDLILGGRTVDLMKDIDFVLNKQFTDFEDLTSIVVDFSKTIKVPMTPNNNEIFNFVYRLEHRVLLGSDYFNYDPSQKIDMKLQFNGVLAMEGYAVLKSVDIKEKTYEINIFGQLGKIFSDLKEKTLREYSFTNGFGKSVKMHRDTIHASYVASTRSSSWDSTTWTDFFGFAPQDYGYDDTVNCKSYESLTGGEFIDFAETLNDKWSTSDSKFEGGSSLIGNGLRLQQYGELRSYMHRPYVYVDKLVNMLVHEVNDDKEDKYNGYKFQLDASWFNVNNPYFSRLCYFPAKGNLIEKDANSTEEYINTTITPLTQLLDVNQTPYTEMVVVNSTELSGSTYEITDGFEDPDHSELITITLEDGSTSSVRLTSNGSNILINEVDTFSVGRWQTNGNNEMPYSYYRNYVKPGYVVTDGTVPFKYIELLDDSNNVVGVLSIQDDINLRNNYDTTLNADALFEKVKNYYYNPINAVGRECVPTVEDRSTWPYPQWNKIKFTKKYEFEPIQLNNNAVRFRYVIDMVDINTGEPKTKGVTFGVGRCIPSFIAHLPHAWPSSFMDYDNFREIKYTENSAEITFEISEGTFRSNATVTIYDILGKDFNPFTWFLEYCKAYRLYFDIDYVNKIIKVTNNLFSTIEYKDIIVDYSKGVVVEPLVSTYKDVKFGYANNENIKGKQYVERFGYEYGDYKTPTGINISTDELTINSNEELSVFMPKNNNAITWNYLFNELMTSTKVRRENIIGVNNIVQTLDEDNKIAKFPFYAFRLSNKEGKILVSDDSLYMANHNTYTLHHRERNLIRTETSIPRFDNYYLYLNRLIAKLKNDGSGDIAHAPSRPGSGITLPTTSIDVDKKIDQTVNFPNEDLSQTTDSSADASTGSSLYVNSTIKDTITIPNVGSASNTDVGNIVLEAGTGKMLDTGSISTGDLKIYYNEYWCTWVTPKEVYNGSSGITPGAVYNIYNTRWEKWLNELFDVNNKKVTCYVRMSYPEFINFKVNQLFVIENNLFLVNKIIDFNPNSDDPTKVELIQISNINNLK